MKSCIVINFTKQKTGKVKVKMETNARVAGRRKQTKESEAEQLCMDIKYSKGLNESDDLSVSDLTKESL